MKFGEVPRCGVDGTYRMQRLNPLRFPVGLALVLLLAAATRLARLRSLPPGLLNAAAANGLLGREALGGGMRLLSAAGARSPLLAGLIALVGRIGGFDQLTPRLGAAVAGILAVCCTCLWLRRALGPGWGLAGGLLLAGSFWALLFSRVGLSPIAGALALAILLWLLGEALTRSWPAAFPWYLAAGIVAGIGYIADPTLRVMPLLLLVLIAGAAWERAHRARHPHPHVHGTPPGRAGCQPALAVIEGQSSTQRCAGAKSGAGPRLDLNGAIVVTIVAVLVALPWVVAQRGHPARLAFWAPTPGLPGIASGSFTTGLRGYGLSLTRLVWPGGAEPGLNLPAGSLLGWFVAPWAVLGLLALLSELRKTRRPILAVGLVSGALLLLPAALSDPGHPGRLIAALPLLLVLPLLGMRTLVGWAARWRRRGRAVVQGVVVALLIVTLAGSVVWSLQSYFQQWAPAAATAHAFNADLVDALGAVNRLPAGEPVLLSTTGTGRDDLVRYLTESESGARVGASSPPSAALTRFDGARVLPLWSESDGWLVVPAGTPVAPALMQIFAGQQPAQIGHDAQGRETYRVYRVDSRVRQQLPLSVPTIPFNNGVVFAGYRLTPERGGRLATVLAWQVPGGSGPERVEVRLSRDNAAAPLSQATVALPATPTGQPVYLLCQANLQAPDTSQPVNFSVALRDARGRLITSPVAGSDSFVLLDRFQFQR